MPTRLSLADALRIGRLDAHGQAALVAAGELARGDLVEAAILRIERLDPAVNAVSHRAFDLARERAAASSGSALAGVPYLVKDSLAYPGMPSRAASRSRGDEPPAKVYPFIRRFDAAGLVPVGKSSMAEFGLLVSNEPLRYGPTANPWDLARSPGGSSGGAAAAVAAGLVPIAHGSDAAGSIRVPAAACGLVGLKTTRGAHVGARTAHWLDDMLCSDGMLARSVRDVAWAFATASRAPRAPVEARPARRLRIARVLEGMDGGAPEPAVADAIARTADLCRTLGHIVVDAERPASHVQVLDAELAMLWPFLGAEAVEQARAAHPDRPLDTLLEPWTIALAERCGVVTPARMATAIGGLAGALAEAQAADDALLDGVDVVLSPTTAAPSLRTGALSPELRFELIQARFAQFSPYTPLQNMAGGPAISLPLFPTPAGLPVGSMFAARRGQDERLLSLALELEAAQPWAARWPALYAEAEAAA